ncbi:hypothetical protein KAM478_18430 [Aeromonas caviae]|nr:hypothetical protein KAM465_00030 [Aeromonas caviae]GKR12993.1 hypothetical protein KAM466_03110 [Aeromonas caviae]GKR57476.1 hypothetical protein KAM476_23410 [Aeromonas caviae]GKR62626.1 hypothetical protein KAM477_32480 [Aeromonas caviae]GKR65586.1 hypothetical protein KAM478_18430 [Aeromonas caviae]
MSPRGRQRSRIQFGAPPHAVDVAGDDPIELPLLFQCRQGPFITEIERRFDGDQPMGQCEGRRLTANL